MAQNNFVSGCCGCLFFIVLGGGIIGGFQSCNSSNDKSTQYCRKVYIGDGRGNGRYEEVCK